MADCTSPHEPPGAVLDLAGGAGSVGLTRPVLEYQGKGRVLARTIDPGEIRAAYERGLSTVDL